MLLIKYVYIVECKQFGKNGKLLKHFARIENRLKDSALQTTLAFSLLGKSVIMIILRWCHEFLISFRVMVPYFVRTACVSDMITNLYPCVGILAYRWDVLHGGRMCMCLLSLHKWTYSKLCACG